jgi:hypothetical protein
VISQVCKEITQKVLNLLLIPDYGDFQRAYANLQADPSYLQFTQIQEMFQYLSGKIPKKDFTAKGLVRFKELLLQQLKTLFVSFRNEFKEISLDFFHRQWVLFFQPDADENSEPRDNDLLRYLIASI